MILGVLDLSVVIAAIVTIFKPARELMRMMNTLPPVIRGLIVAILNFVLPLLINILVMIIIAVVIEVAAQFFRGSLLGGSLILSRFMKIFSQAAKVFQDCTQPGALGIACKRLPGWFPEIFKRPVQHCLKDLGETVGDLAGSAVGGGVGYTDIGLAVVEACAFNKLNADIIDSGNWRQVDWNGRAVWKNDSLIDLDRVDPKSGLTSRELMRAGRPPVGPDGKQLELHHMLQEEPGPLAEVTVSYQDDPSYYLHEYPKNPPNPVDRGAFAPVRAQYWLDRLEELEGA